MNLVGIITSMFKTLYGFDLKMGFKYHQYFRHGTDAQDVHCDADLHRWTCKAAQLTTGVTTCKELVHTYQLAATAKCVAPNSPSQLLASERTF